MMKAVLKATGELVALLSPQRVEAVAAKIRNSSASDPDRTLRDLVTTPAGRSSMDRLLGAWQQSSVSGEVLAGILVGASHAREQTLREASIELVWTGPTTPFVPTRRTEQVLLDLINQADVDLFIVSFVAYDVQSVVEALNAAGDRGVDIRILLETSTSFGGSLSVDPVGAMASRVPAASLYVWTDRPEPFTDGRVHAKVAVADGKIAFLTSANLTGHALEKNMEAGVIISGSHVPAALRSHLLALIEIKAIRKP